MIHLPALVTLLIVILYIYTGILVAKARVSTGIKAPATSGHPDFERAFRVQMNMLEWLPIVLPAMWLMAIYVNFTGAGVLGLVWIVGRIIYMRAYAVAPEKRGTGFTIQAFAALAMWIVALLGVLTTMFNI